MPHDYGNQCSLSTRLADICSRLHVDVAVATTTSSSDVATSTNTAGGGNGHERGENGKLKTWGQVVSDKHLPWNMSHVISVVQVNRAPSTFFHSDRHSSMRMIFACTACV